MPYRFNLHNHSTRSDGVCEPRDLVEQATAVGLTHFALSDHLRSTRLDTGQGLELEGLADYAAELRGLRIQYRDRVTVLAGVEVTFSLAYTDFTFLSRYDPDKNPLNRLDFVLFEAVNDGEAFGLGLEELLKVRGLLQVPIGLAHNDLTRNFSGVLPPESLAKILAQAQIFVELCPTRRHSRPGPGPAFTPYYRVGGEFNRRFFAAAGREQVRFSIGCDVHADLRDLAEVGDAAAFLEESGLQGRAVIDHYWQART